MFTSDSKMQREKASGYILGPKRGVWGIVRPFRLILGGSRGLHAPPKGVKMAIIPVQNGGLAGL